MSGPNAIAVRAYTEAAGKKRGGTAQGSDMPSTWTLIFDCETTTDASQRLRLGAYQIRKHAELFEEGLFADADALDAEELDILVSYCREHDIKCRSVAEFVDFVFYRIAYDRRGQVVGFNLPFDISRIAIGHNPARGSMRGGFSFRLSRWKQRAAVRLKHLSRRASLIDLARPGVQETAGASRKRGLKTPVHRGYFVDVSTLASALMSETFSLQRLCDRLETTTRKLDAGDHDQPISSHYLDYARTDVQATWECFESLKAIYAQHNLATPLHRILSEASIGKAYFGAMGRLPLLHVQPDVSRSIFGKIMCAYYGGRAEVHWRRTIKLIAYCDFKSMYPTVNALMGLWRFVIADGVSWRDGTLECRQILENASAETFRNPDAWRDLTAIVRVKPDHDLFPVRAEYGDGQYTIGLNYLTHTGPLWMTLADCVAAKILSGKAPRIEEALIFSPGPPQEGLKPIDLFGDPDYRVDPATEDVFKRLVDLRDAAKARRDPNEKAIKIIVNATSYGVFIEIIRDDAPKSEHVFVWGVDGRQRIIRSKAIEHPGRCFHPLLGVLITGAARLMLALAERNALDAGLDWAFCDTDSIAMVKPDELSEADFSQRVEQVVDWFVPLNPYEKPGSILKIEDVNFALDEDGKASDRLEPLFCFAISAKRYALFNLDSEGLPILRKASAHGLGHLLAPYREAEAPPQIPLPRSSLSEIGVGRWQYDLWFEIVRAALAGHADQVSLDYHPALSRPAASRFGITSPRLERWMRFGNARHAYPERARPFGFMLTFSPRIAAPTASDGVVARRGRPRKIQQPKPIASFNRDIAKAADGAFDRETGAPVGADILKTYAEALAQYHLHPEDKFLAGDFMDSGRTERRHVTASWVQLIGKEANKWEELPLQDSADGVAGFGKCSLEKGN